MNPEPLEVEPGVEPNSDSPNEGASAAPSSWRLRLPTRTTAVIAIAGLAYGAMVLSVANSNRDWGLNDTKPRFQTPPPGSLPVLPSADDLGTSVVAYRPTQFDEELKRLNLELQLRPAPVVGEVIGDSFEILGSRVLLQMPGAVVQDETRSSSILLEGSASVVSNALLMAMREAGPEFASNEFIQSLQSNADRRLEDVQLYGPIDVSIASQTYGRAFQASDNKFWFPFDTYGFIFNLNARRRALVDLSGQNIGYEGTEWLTMPLNLFPNRGAVGARVLYEHQVGNWEVRSWPTSYTNLGMGASLEEVAESWGVGLRTVHFHARRPFPVKMLAAVFGLVYIASAVALVVVVREIACGSRPPTGNMLVWAAALIFASVSLRQGLPGEIPVGVLFDRVFFFPILLLSIASTLYLAVKWVQRADYTP